MKKQLDDLNDELTDLIDNVGGNGTGILDIISLAASLTSLGTSLASLGLKAGTALTSLALPGGTALAGVLAAASLAKNSEGQITATTAQKIANGTSLNDYAPDPENWVESQADLDRLRQGARDVETNASRPTNSVGGSWLNAPLQAPLFIQRQLFGALDLVA